MWNMSITSLGILAFAGNLLGLLFVYIFNVNITNQAHSHRIAAGFAFGMAILGSFCFLVRRCLDPYYRNIYKWQGLTINGIILLMQIILSIVLVLYISGISEFLLSLCIIADRIFLMSDIYYACWGNDHVKRTIIYEEKLLADIHQDLTSKNMFQAKTIATQ